MGDQEECPVTKVNGVTGFWDCTIAVLGEHFAAKGNGKSFDFP